MEPAILVTDKALISLAESYIETEYADVGTTVFYYECCDDLDDDTSCYTSAESLPRPDQDCDQWAELTDLTIISAEVSARDDQQGSYSVIVNVKVTWFWYSGEYDEQGTKETSTRNLSVAIFRQDGRLFVDQVEE